MSVKCSKKMKFDITIFKTFIDITFWAANTTNTNGKTKQSFRQPCKEIGGRNRNYLLDASEI
jgi:hypothetical protein